jgi:hypothetical protein
MNESPLLACVVLPKTRSELEAQVEARGTEGMWPAQGDGGSDVHGQQQASELHPLWADYN